MAYAATKDIFLTNFKKILNTIAEILIWWIKDAKIMTKVVVKNVKINMLLLQPVK